MAEVSSGSLARHLTILTPELLTNVAQTELILRPTQTAKQLASAPTISRPPGPASTKHCPCPQVLSASPLPSWAKDTLYKAQLPGLENLSLPAVLERTRHLLAANIKSCGQVVTIVCCSIYAKVEAIKALQTET